MNKLIEIFIDNCYEQYQMCVDINMSDMLLSEWVSKHLV